MYIVSLKTPKHDIAILHCLDRTERAIRITSLQLAVTDHDVEIVILVAVYAACLTRRQA